MVRVYVSVKVSITVKRHHDQGDSYKGKHLIGASLQDQRFRPLSSWQETGSMQAGIALEKECSTPCSKGEQENISQAARRVSKASPTVTHFLQQNHTYSNKATPPTSATP